MNTFFTSDTHFFHKNIIKYCPNSRGHFNNEEEMNESIIDNWNNKVTNKDVVYHLGDFAFTNINNAIEIIKRLNGSKILVPGNHDHKLIKSEEFTKYFNKILPSYYELKINNKFIILCHYPILEWNGKSHNALHFHGHSHGSLKYHNQAIDVGIDTNHTGTYTLAPYELSEIS